MYDTIPSMAFRDQITEHRSQSTEHRSDHITGTLVICVIRNGLLEIRSQNTDHRAQSTEHMTHDTAHF